MVTGVVAVTKSVVMENLAESTLPARTCTVGGTPARTGFELLSATVMPPAGAGLSSLTKLLVVTRPPAAVHGLRITDCGNSGLTMKVAVASAPPYVPVMVTLVGVVTAEVVIVKGGDVNPPAATVTLEGTEATVGLELESEMTAPPAGAAPARFTVLPVSKAPPRTCAADNVTDEMP
jgi:hypothetical protein